MGFWSSLKSGLKAVGNFAANHWKEIVVVAVSTVVFGAVLVATGGTAALLAPTLLQLAAAGVVSGAAGQITADLLDHKTPTVKGVLKAAAIGGIVTVATAGLGRFVPGLSRPLTNPIAQRAVITAAGSAGGAGAQVLSNAVDGKPLLKDVGTAAVRGGATTLLASEGVRLLAPRIVNMSRAGTEQQGPRGREILPEPEPDPLLVSKEEASTLATNASKTLAEEIRSPNGTPVKGKALDELPRGVAADVDRATGKTEVGVTGGPLNAKVAKVMAEQGIDLAALEKNLDAQGLRDALKNPAVRDAIGPKLADAMAKLPNDKLVIPDPQTGKPFLALPWNCAEMQALSASINAGADPKNVVSATTYGKTNAGKIGMTGTPFQGCERCQFIHDELGVHSATDASLANRPHTHTTDTTIPGNNVTTTSNTAGTEVTPPPTSTGINKALGQIGGH